MLHVQQLINAAIAADKGLQIHSDDCIHMNVDKTSLMLCGRSKKLASLPDPDITVNNIPVTLVPNYTYLGITLDSQLNYNKHVQKCITKVSVKLKQFRRMNMILPMIEYGDMFLTSATVANRRNLQVLQNKGLSCALKRDMDTSVVELHKVAKLSKLKHRREGHLMVHMFGMAQDKSNLKKRVTEGVQTRSSNNKMLRIRKPITDFFKKSLAYMGPQKWNALPEELHHIVSQNRFHRKITHHIENGQSSKENEGNHIGI